MTKPQLRAEQGWIFDNFLMLSENEDVLHPGIMGTRVERGFKPEDLKAVYSKVTGRRSFPKAWRKRAEVLERMAREAEGKSRDVTARGLYHRAALCFGRAQHLIPVHNNANKIAAYEGLYRCYDRVIAMSGGTMEKTEVTFAGGLKAHAVYSAAPGEGPKPTIVVLPGMDAIKEDVINPFANLYADRGMNVCAMDGPGQGECNYNATWQSEHNYEEAVSAVIDWLAGREDVDAERIGVMGMSMGSRWGVLAAAHDPRIKAVCGQMANVGSFDMIFEQAQPNFKRIFMYMTNHSDEAEFDQFVSRLTQVRDAAREVKCPHLLVAGDMDELCPPEDIDAFRTNLAGPSELWLYEGVFHPMGEVAAEIYPAIADWLLTTLNQGRPEGYDSHVYIEEGTTLSDYHHG
ncbi:MAG: prolyl oligopeptidase family serine peptidase [Rhizobiales bacterium]|nr:prolyl oligopeptidase family serine peptidase [Hyphomicrobiales bacterium]